MSRKVKPMETKRLILREIEEEDSAFITQWRSEPYIYQYFYSPKPVTEEEHLNWFFNDYEKDENRIDFMTLEKNSKEKIGVFSIKCLRNSQYSEIGYLLKKNAQGMGYAQEAVRKLMTFVKEEWKSKKVVLSIHEDNVSSQRLADKLGYEKNGKKGKFVLYYFDLMDDFVEDKLNK